MTMAVVQSVTAYYFILFAIYATAGFVAQAFYTKLASNFVPDIVAQNFFYFLPMTPIFGVGAVIIILIAQWCGWSVEQPWWPFIITGGVGTLLEYATGRLFILWQGKNTFWDYTGQPFNFQGQICLLSSVLFAVVGTIVINVIQPWLHPMLQALFASGYWRVTAGLLVILVGADLGYSFWRRWQVGRLV
jgi:uncharacterized membrane protein